MFLLSYLLRRWYLPGGDLSWSLNFEVWHQVAYFVLMCYGHSISSPSLEIPHCLHTYFTYLLHTVGALSVNGA